MCLAAPMRIVAIDGLVARCEARGVVREVSLLLLHDEPLDSGDYVAVQFGHAIRKVSEEEARDAWVLYDLMLALEAGPAQ
jgi:hydrogenase expression/formation protein HypC